MPPLLTMPQKEKDRFEMIEAAIKYLAPKTYRQIKKAGKLQAFVQQRESDMMESYHQAEDEMRFRWAQKVEPDFLKHVQDYETRTRELWEQTMATWLEFSDPAPPD
jgi:hypothetical protein